jgi:carbohydrate-selective porin OprB
VFGAAINSVDSATPGTPRETNYEIFYRFPLFLNVDLTLNYQYIDNPATNTEYDNASAFALRLVTTF